jgi:hypothetical protein
MDGFHFGEDKKKRKKNTPRQKHWIEDISFVIYTLFLVLQQNVINFKAIPSMKAHGHWGTKTHMSEVDEQNCGSLLSHLPLCPRSTQAIAKP